MAFDPNAQCNPDKSVSLCTNPVPQGNVWFVRNTCKLDQVQLGVVVRVLEHIPRAKKDLLAITDDEMLIQMANTIKLVVPDQEENDIVQKRLSANTLPYYTLFRGRGVGVSQTRDNGTGAPVIVPVKDE
jgi:hypothetical protein